MAEQILTKLSTSDILEKEFRTELRGYSTNEVDEYLDDIIADYASLYKEVANLREENEALKLEVQKGMTKTLSTPTTDAPVAQSSNYDVLRRVSLLEKQVVEIMNHLKKRAQQETE
ncbi:cell cycle protein GpsB [Erysipelotrichaceae bacterium]|nr:cell cycle protein GpsB [Erysipelotrichaceae bacterium]